ncbi:sulfatase family protein [Pareuzebyella sediminis]|uniref:sulfatase family protein n=1 Tax=Pareuzebyella sediminis TaxID=2607998 RepID=UPI0011F01AE7|nr:arylsulfatase [Pareuzebyella sediminis]
MVDLRNMFKYAFTLVFVMVVGCKEQPDEIAVQGAKLPNIIYILADDLGYGDIGAFNPEGKIKTPHIDDLASQGMRFTDAHSPSAVCTPTRYGILTGRYSWRSPLKNGVLTGKSEALIPNERTTVASLLKRKGYRTAFIGKWHLGWNWALKDTTEVGGEGWNAEDFENIDFKGPVENTPNDLGFEYAYGHSGSLDMAPYVYVENGRITAEVDRVTEDTGKYTWWRKGPTASDFVHEQVTPHFFEKSIDYLNEASKEPSPFFMYLALPSPHTPILPTEEWLGKSGINPYADFVMMVDDYVGQLLKVLKEKGLEENTMVVFTSDNGCSPQADFEILAEKGHHPSYIYRGHKADIYEGGHRVPFIVKWPGKVVANSISEATICQTDLMATCAEIAKVGLDDDEAEDSFSILPLLNEDTASEYGRKATVHHSINGSFAVRQGDYKLIFCPGSGGWSDPKPNSIGIDALPAVQLFNLSKDPGEEENLYAEYPEKVKEMKTLMASYIENGRTTAGTKQQNAPLNLQGKPWTQILSIIPEQNKRP